LEITSLCERKLNFCIFEIIVNNTRLNIYRKSAHWFEDVQKYVTHRILVKKEYQVQLHEDIESVKNILLDSNGPIDDSIKLNGPSYLKYKKSPWGCFNILKIEGKYLDYKQKKILYLRQYK
jgi:hypothetical protein